MLEWLTKKGFTVEFKGGEVFLRKGDEMGMYSTLRAAYKANGGPMWANWMKGPANG